MIELAQTRCDQPQMTLSAGLLPSNSIRSILVATDGGRTAGAALRFVAGIAGVQPGSVTVLTILESRTSFLTDAVLDHGDLKRDAVNTDNVMDKVARQLASIGLTHSPLRVGFGDPATAIAEVAREVDASLVVVGHGRHRLLPRLLGGDTITHVLPNAHAPLLVVHREAQGLPSVAVCGVDFGMSSIRSALTAERLLRPGGSLHLVHVGPHINRLQPGWHRVYETGVQSAFARLRRELIREDLSVVTHMMYGDIAPALVDLIREVGPDLVAVGAHNVRGLVSFAVGSVTHSLLRRVNTSLLIAPDWHNLDGNTAIAEAMPSLALSHQA
jgi:nucleotide-binding universal stress UspA family protein